MIGGFTGVERAPCTACLRVVFQHSTMVFVVFGVSHTAIPCFWNDAPKWVWPSINVWWSTHCSRRRTNWKRDFCDPTIDRWATFDRRPFCLRFNLKFFFFSSTFHKSNIRVYYSNMNDYRRGRSDAYWMAEWIQKLFICTTQQHPWLSASLTLPFVSVFACSLRYAFWFPLRQNRPKPVLCRSTVVRVNTLALWMPPHNIMKMTRWMLMWYAGIYCITLVCTTQRAHLPL